MQRSQGDLESGEMSRAWYSTHFGLRTEEADNALRSLKKSKSVDASVCDGNVRKGLWWLNSYAKRNGLAYSHLDGLEIWSHLYR